MKKLLFLTLFIFHVVCLNLSSFSQNLKEFKKVDKFKLSDYTIEVYFKDPLLELIKAYPNFDEKDNQAKHKLLSDYLRHNSLYVFQSIRKNKVQKNYELLGNPKNLRGRSSFSLNVQTADGVLEKNIDKVNLSGEFFEHMVLFQSERGKQAIGKGIQIWGYFVKIEPYETFKNRITELIQMDIENSIPVDLLAKNPETIEPLFDYQRFGLSRVKNRKVTISVLQYDSLGNVLNKYPRVENDEDLYLSSTSKELIWVMAFPWFSAQDSVVKSGNQVKVNSRLENINHYLKDISVFLNPTTRQVERISGKLIIHGYGSEGHSTSDMLYVAEFAPIGESTLPKNIKYTGLNDREFKKPALTIDVEYELN
ncbi:hypothetical protein ACSBL2_15585 [Pedobacter sp. AW31-3R]|uniref:hypothetical protein n=1 Tax=Pedobacter sp. AW31-3R TaxID=3445781 RepID=UPI003FA0081C